jgi:predicted  nucleic acid-binding Zn-ribbon protein
MKLLIGLQECDTRIRYIQAKREEGPVKIERLKADLNVLEKQLESELGRLETCKKERRRSEKEIEELESRIQKSTIKLDNVKSNKEYKAALKEIEDIRRGKSLLEDKVIEIMEEIEELEARCFESNAEKEEFKKRAEEGREEILKEMKVLEEDLVMRERERERFCQAVDGELLRRYDSLRKQKWGLAVSPVIKGVCQTCHMGIPPQQFNELIRGDGLMTCPNCMRIIYWGEDERFRIENPQ